MQEILFKAKRKDNGEWVSGGTIVQFLDDGIRSFYMPQFNEKCDCTHDDATDDILGFENCRFYKVNPDTICRYTGRKDKNGALIWENDFVGFLDVSQYDNGYSEHWCIGEVVWDDETLSFQVTERISCESYEVLNGDCAVVGNKFDNPELLEELGE